ncbi:MAG: carboxypeptidase-like regulatory domain-containing protein [Planctomycetota bacterium]
MTDASGRFVLDEFPDAFEMTILAVNWAPYRYLFDEETPFPSEFRLVRQAAIKVLGLSVSDGTPLYFYLDSEERALFGESRVRRGVATIEGVPADTYNFHLTLSEDRGEIIEHAAMELRDFADIELDTVTSETRSRGGSVVSHPDAFGAFTAAEFQQIELVMPRERVTTILVEASDGAEVADAEVSIETRIGAPLRIVDSGLTDSRGRFVTQALGRTTADLQVVAEGWSNHHSTVPIDAVASGIHRVTLQPLATLVINIACLEETFPNDVVLVQPLGDDLDVSGPQTLRYEDLQPGVHGIKIRVGGITAVETSVRAQAGGTVVVDVVVPSLIAVRGRVLNDGVPVRAGLARLEHGLAFTNVDSAGEFQFQVPGPGYYTFDFHPDDPNAALARVAATITGETKIEISYAMRRIRGRILVEEGGPVPGVSGWLRNTVTDEDLEFSTDGEGEFFAEVCAGKYRLLIGSGVPESYCLPQTQFDVLDNDLVEIVLRRGVERRIRVLGPVDKFPGPHVYAVVDGVRTSIEEEQASESGEYSLIWPAEATHGFVNFHDYPLTPFRIGRADEVVVVTIPRGGRLSVSVVDEKTRSLVSYPVRVRSFDEIGTAIEVHEMRTGIPFGTILVMPGTCELETTLPSGRVVRRVVPIRDGESQSVVLAADRP